MSATLLASNAGAAVYHASHLELLATLSRRADGTACDALILDAPYSEKTHSGHAEGAQTANRALAWAQANPEHAHAAEVRYALGGAGERRKINYPHWTEADVRECVAAWSPVTRGWFVSITDDTLAPVWEAALEAAGRKTFQRLPFVAPGSRVRLNGDGPSCWTCWVVVGEAAESIGDRIVVARPRTREFASWGTLPGAYILPEGEGTGGKKRMPIVGGKPPWLMRRLVEDYSRPGDLVCDPTCGGGTTLRAAQVLGRSAVGADILLAHAEIAAREIRKPCQAATLFAEAAPAQNSLFEVKR